LACQALGLLGNDKEWIKAFDDVVATTTSPQLRELFVS